jgi:large subunit ribosomal protein L28
MIKSPEKGEADMSYKCVICEKGPSAGKNVSHSKRATPRFFYPNLQKMRFKYKGKVMRGYVCTKCIKSGFIEKV